ncbi:hypothetical protein DSECCO2_339960 [anaerobic digester metagenome]
MDKKTGIVGLTGSFREAVADLPEGSKVVFTGSAAVCTPFIELLSYSIRDKGFEMVFIPNADKGEARKIKKQENIGMSVVDEAADPRNPDVVVVMGGLAMPKFGCPAEDVTAMINGISEEDPLIIGVCFMGIFKRSGWDEKIHFNTIIDTTMETQVKNL